MGELDFLKRYSGKKPVKRGYRIPVSPHAMAHIGHITLQWASLMYEIETQINFKSKNPLVPIELRKAPRREAGQQIKHLLRIARHVYKNEKKAVIPEFKRILDRILELKTTRDALVHGLFGAMDNHDPDIVVVIYSKGKKSFAINHLAITADEIGAAHGTLIEFDSWVHYEQNRASFGKLLQQVRK